MDYVQRSKSKLPLQFIKKAIHESGLTPSSVQLTQNTTTHINLVLKKKK